MEKWEGKKQTYLHQKKQKLLEEGEAVEESLKASEQAS